MTAMTDERIKRLQDQKCRRGDVIAWAERHYYTYANSTSTAEVTYQIGIVTKVTRDGIVRLADTSFGAPTAVNHDIASAAVRGERIDLDVARAWLASDANYPRRGSTPLRSMDEVRAVVRQWLKPEVTS